MKTMKKKTQMMIKRREPSALLPQLFGNLNPPPLKPIPYNGGYLKLMWEGGKLKRIKEMHVLQAEIREAMYRETKATADSFFEAMTLPRKIELYHQEALHRQIMMLQEQEKGKDEARFRKGMIEYEEDKGNDEARHRKIMMQHTETKSGAEAKNAVFESRITELEFQAREREFLQMLKEQEDERDETED
jgi:exonuclease I